MKATLELDGHVHQVTLEQDDDGRWHADVDGHKYRLHVDRSGPGAVVSVDGTVHVFDHVGEDHARIDGSETPYRLLALQGVAGAEDAAASQYGPVRPPMTGKLDAVLVESGQVVAAGDVLFVLEAMKMRNEVKAPADGVVTTIHAKAGDAVDTGTVVLELAPPEAREG